MGRPHPTEPRRKGHRPFLVDRQPVLLQLADEALEEFVGRAKGQVGFAAGAEFGPVLIQLLLGEAQDACLERTQLLLHLLPLVVVQVIVGRPVAHLVVERRRFLSHEWHVHPRAVGQGRHVPVEEFFEGFLACFESADLLAQFLIARAKCLPFLLAALLQGGRDEFQKAPATFVEFGQFTHKDVQDVGGKEHPDDKGHRQERLHLPVEPFFPPFQALFQPNRQHAQCQVEHPEKEAGEKDRYEKRLAKVAGDLFEDGAEHGASPFAFRRVLLNQDHATVGRDFAQQ